MCVQAEWVCEGVRGSDCVNAEFMGLRVSARLGV